MNYEKAKKRNKLILIALLLMISLGYALLNANLRINGTSKIKNSTWDIHWNNVQVKTGSVSIGTGDVAAAIKQNDTTEVNYTVTLNKPGDFYEFTVDAVNGGSIDAMIDVITSTYKIGEGEVTTITSSNLPAYLDYSVSYSDGTALLQNQELKAGESETYKVRVEYKKDITENDLPSTDQSIAFSFSVTYKQGDSNAITVDHPITLYGVNGDGLNGSLTYLNQPVPANITLRRTPNEAMNDWITFYEQGSAYPFYLKYKTVNNIIRESSIEFIFTPEDVVEAANYGDNLTAGTYTLRGGVDESSLSEKPIYEANKAQLLSAFGSSNCDDYNSSFSCEINDNEINLLPTISTDGSVWIGRGGWHCNIENNGSADCEWQ